MTIKWVYGWEPSGHCLLGRHLEKKPGNLPSPEKRQTITTAPSVHRRSRPHPWWHRRGARLSGGVNTLSLSSSRLRCCGSDKITWRLCLAGPACDDPRQPAVTDPRLLTLHSEPCGGWSRHPLHGAPLTSPTQPPYSLAPSGTTPVLSPSEPPACSAPPHSPASSMDSPPRPG